MRILLTEGSGLTSRQVATRLGELGHDVEVLSSTRLCLTRFTRHVRRVHAVPRFGEDPLAWLDAACTVARERRADLLFPTQEQVAVLSAFASGLEVRTVVPPFDALMQLQDKRAQSLTLARLGLPQPAFTIATGAESLAGVRTFPVYVKRPVSTASSGVRRATNPGELALAARALGLAGDGVVVQSQADGPLAMVQAIADGGRLIACHANLRLRDGAGGGASSKESIAVPAIAEHVEVLVGALRWHGPISLDAILTATGPVYIDVNPRLVEPGNALAAGVDLVAAMVALARGEHPPPGRPGPSGVRSHQLLLAVLGAAAERHGRLAVCRELADCLLRRDGYRASVEELTPVRRDPLGALPVAVAAATTLIRPQSWRWFVKESVDSYALTPGGWAEIASARRAAASTS